MRRRLVLLGWILVTSLVTAPAAKAADCELDGTIPGTEAKTYEVSAGGQTLYIDDRDYFDLDDDGAAGGVWLYVESNGVPGLQYAQHAAAFAMLPITVPAVPGEDAWIVPSPGVTHSVSSPAPLPPLAQNRRTSLQNGLVIFETTADTVSVTLFGPRDVPLPPEEEAADNRPNAGGYRIRSGSVWAGGPLGPALAEAVGEQDPCYAGGTGDSLIL